MSDLHERTPSACGQSPFSWRGRQSELPLLARRPAAARSSFRAVVARITKMVNSRERLLHRRDNAVYFRPKVFRLELSSLTAEIRDICEQRSVQAAKLGYAGALDLARVLADFEAFDSYPEFEALFGSQVSSVSKSEKRIVLKSGLSISFRSGHPRNLGTSAAPTDWSKVSRLMITAIESPNA
ncbi:MULTISPECIES: hypothetical protein [unclassified Bradyrhizobium]|uniref:hypothetical protein n=1 Tax=unclassified Bradyrhizobium TaxID=2631580 RepID=UPI0033927EB3